MRKALTAAGAAVLLAGVQLSPALATPIGPLPAPDSYMYNQGGLLIFVTNQTSSPIAVNWLANNNGSCATNTFMYYNVNWDTPGNHTTPETEYPTVSDGNATVAPGQTGWISAWSSNAGCNGDPQTSMGTWLFGLVGVAQFELGTQFASGSNSPKDYTWTQTYTVGGPTGGMYMYNCGDGTLLGGGRGSKGQNYTYDTGSNMCMVVQSGAFNPQAALSANATVPNL